MERHQYCKDENAVAAVRRELAEYMEHGGRVQMENGEYPLQEALIVDASSLCLCGDVWACNTDPNGVFETDHGTKLRMQGKDFAAIRVGEKTDPISGVVVKNLGVQGDIRGMDTRPYVDFDHPEKMAGLCLSAVRTDQCEFSKLSFCGLANGVCASENAEIDACLFEKLNVDGCGNGIWFAPRASFYAHIRSCVLADNPYYAFYAEGKGRVIHNLDISDCIFVRSGGAFREGDGRIPAAVLLDHINNCAIDRCLFDDPGTHWYFPPDAEKNEQRRPSYRKTVALCIIGNENRITGNTFLHSSDDAIRVEGNANVLMNNIADHSVRIRGRGNQVIGLAFTSPEGKLILEGEAAESTYITGVDEGRIIRR